MHAYRISFLKRKDTVSGDSGRRSRSISYFWPGVVPSGVKPPADQLPTLVAQSRRGRGQREEEAMTLSRRKRRQEEEPEADAHGCASPPGSKRRRRRRPSAGPVDAPGAAGVVAVDRVGDAALDRRDGGSAAVLVNGLPFGCTVLGLKSRMQMYGTISRIRIDGESGLGFVTYRSLDSARAAVSASADPAFGIVIGSSRVHVSQASDPLSQCHTPSKLLKAELPLRKHGRGHRNLSEGLASCKKTTPEMPYKGRPIVAYDDLL
ncbi:hypothetical protein Taro_044347 [Colocasia esculenta]|uniref:RRM domain-containing protein n=1 Tax=Colocasia esculenta TaxID=4460 RepID=A0A843X5C8_COLES|nr:hypothetical protein [Colocasia esculenta]